MVYHGQDSDYLVAQKFGNFTQAEQEMIARADALAVRAHEGQPRNYTSLPYIVHPRAVAVLVYTAELDAETVAAALLHDTIEDTSVTADEVRAEFGDKIAHTVLELTDVPREFGNRATRKTEDIRRLALASPAAQSIKAADLTHNTVSIVERDPGFAVRYLKEKRATLDALTRAEARLLGAAFDVLESGERKIFGKALK